MQRPNLSEWQTDVLPIRAGFYLVSIVGNTGKVFTGYAYYKDQCWYTLSKRHPITNVIAWHLMPLPYAPPSQIGMPANRSDFDNTNPGPTDTDWDSVQWTTHTS